MMLSAADAIGCVAFSHASLIENGLAQRSCVMASEGAKILLAELGHDTVVVHRTDVFGWNLNYGRATLGKPLRENKAQAYSIRLTHDAKANGDGYDGHCVFEFNGMIYDLTAGQFSRPQYSIHSGDPARFDLTDFGKLPKRLSPFISNPKEGVKWINDLTDDDAPTEFITTNAVNQEQLLVIAEKNKLGQPTGQVVVYALRPDIDDSGYINDVKRDMTFKERLHEWLDECWRPALVSYVANLERGLEVAKDGEE